MTTRKKLGIGLIGVGRLGRVYARDLATRIPETRLVAVADPDPAARAEVAAEYDVPQRSTPTRTRSSTTRRIDAVVIVSPTHTHRELRRGGGGARQADLLREAPGADAGARRAR